MQRILPGIVSRTTLRTMRTTRPTRTTRTALTLAAAGIATVLAAPAWADVADVIPADALVVIKANNIQNVSDDIAALAREWGLDQAVDPAFADPIGTFKQETGMEAGIDFAGNGALYLANGDMEGDMPPMVILIPITDYQAFLGNFEDVRQEDGLDVANMPGGDSPTYFANWGEYAAMSPDANLVRAKPMQTMTFAGPTGGQLEERDLTLYANFAQLGPMLMAAMEEEGGKEKALAEFSAGFDEDAPDSVKPYKPVIEAGISQFFAVAESFFRDADAATVSLEIDPEAGVSSNVIAQFKPNSYLANLFGGINASGDSLLDGLPKGKYLMFGGSVGDPEASAQLFNDLAGPVVAELEQVEGGELQDMLMDYVASISSMVEASESARFGLFTPPPGLGGGALIQQVTIQSGDAQAMMDATRNLAEMMPKMMAEFGALAGAPAGQMPAVGVEFTENAKSIAGVNFSKIETQLPMDDPQMAMIMNMVFGPDGQSQYMAVVGDSLVNVSGLNDQQMTEVVNAVKAGDDPLANAAGVSMVNDNLPGERSAVMYFQLAEFARTGLGYLQMFGQAPPVRIPENLPPIGIAVGPEENSLQISTFVPKDLVSAMIVTALEVQQAQGGGGL